MEEAIAFLETLGKRVSKVTNYIREGELARQELQVIYQKKKKLHTDTCPWPACETCYRPNSSFTFPPYLEGEIECKKRINTSDIIVRIVLDVKSFVEGDLDKLLPFPNQTFYGHEIDQSCTRIMWKRTPNAFYRMIVHTLCKACGLYSRRWYSEKDYQVVCRGCGADFVQISNPGCGDLQCCGCCPGTCFIQGYKLEPRTYFDSVVISRNPLPMNNGKLQEMRE
ncbi:hypothetical protein BQ9231_00455 [Cedratvirus lausannensis]|uniref:Uncharacterized protein n=1 Tax=Cedratvirus lausannensis TaxID=2023205 RepID=A0A285PXE0_9VIRU|nr:hypothetical protein BQ9231_00455 [Cedratvirus lausannensis]